MSAQSAGSLRLRAGDEVVVRSRAEILATLDAEGKLDGMPFMPEMLAFCGRRTRVAAVAHKTCDPAHKTGGRRLDRTVHLDGLRCDGSAHGGCQANCNLFFKTAWLRPDDGTAADTAVEAPGTDAELTLTTQTPDSTPERPIYSCQATCVFSAGRPLKWWHIDQYLRDVLSRNVSAGHAVKMLSLSWLRALTRAGFAYRATRAAYRRAHWLLMGRPAPLETGGVVPRGQPTPIASLGLKPGQWVQVRSNEEIRATLAEDGKNRGMWFDEEATVFCGRRFEVERRVERIVNEVTGEMMQMKTPCITLKGVYCPSLYSRERLFCPRQITPYWREIWLKPADPAADPR